ncbi:MAG: hypothetical protein NTX48_11530 [Planctomycetales bacterium]|nr:hypothetical protein [Planctomycetales bacterium]
MESESPGDGVSREERNQFVQVTDELYFKQLSQIPNDDDHIGRYIHVKAHMLGIKLSEAGKLCLARLFDAALSARNVVVILTAFRNDHTLQQNRLSNVSLHSDIRHLGWGCTPLAGIYVEMVKPVEMHVEYEESLFVNATGSPPQVIAATLRLLHKHQQKAALVRMADNEVLTFFADGTTQPLGQWRPDPEHVSQNYAQMKIQLPIRQFRFKAAGDDSVMTRMAVEAFFRNR